MKFNKKFYRRKIIFFKFVIVIILGTLISIICYTLFHNQKKEEVKHESKVSANYDVSISNSLFEGSEKHGENYQLSSKSLIKTGDDLYDLETITGKYNLGQIKVDFKANKGKMDDNTKYIKLLHNIVIEYGGYLLKTDEMDINLSKMSANNNNKVSVLYRSSNIRADRFTLSSDSNTIYFEGNVLTHFKISDF